MRFNKTISSDLDWGDEEVLVKNEREAEDPNSEKIIFKREKLRRVFKGTSIPVGLAEKIEEKSRSDDVPESFVIQKILESWFSKYS